MAGLIFIVKRRKNRSFNQLQTNEELPSSIPSESLSSQNESGEQALNNLGSQVDKNSPIDTAPPKS